MPRSPFNINIKKYLYSRQPTDQLNQNVGIEVSYLVYDFCLVIQMSEGKSIHIRDCTRSEPACVLVFVCVSVCVFVYLLNCT